MGEDRTQQQETEAASLSFTDAQLERLWLNTPETIRDNLSRPRFKRLVQFIEAAHGIKEPT